MVIRTLFIIATLLGWVSLAAAQPLLRAEIRVDAAVVTVGDMFDDAGLIAEQPLFRAPLPGTTGTVPLADVRAAARRIGLTAFSTGALDSVRVSRAASVVDETLLTGLIAQDLRARGILTAAMSAQTLFDRQVDPINAAFSDAPATLLTLRYLPATGAFTARFSLAGIERALDVSGTLDLMIQTPHLAASLPAGAILSAADIVMQPVPLKFAETSGVITIDQLVGKQLQRPSREGMALKPADVATAQLIARNQFVTIYFRQGLMTLTVKGQAMAGAAPGATVPVLNLMSNKVVTAIASAPGAVEVNSRGIDVAGL